MKTRIAYAAMLALSCAPSESSDVRVSTTATTSPTDCDQDADGIEGPQCGGHDCCDIDAEAHPNVTAWHSAPTMCGDFDFDCSGTDEPRYTASYTCGGSAPNCYGTPGWLGTAPACGESASVVTSCSGSTCSQPTMNTLTQQCR